MDELDDASTTAEDEEDFESREFEHEIAFQFFGKRLSCFAHTLQYYYELRIYEYSNTNFVL